ncbi:facilitated trehalose transporter Tret1-like [Bombyx mandarina]|uniref:Facilitated trehalose transporter Tret1-like n=1 Tax=Bombyx mandarina TaxID=7092 RepID=A0A6J2KK50_BOMMA|nr:facilitated trehalose transporter Tret1-like [Bombyx mandarina]
MSLKPERGHTYVQWMVALLANTTLLTYGLQAGWISPMTKTLQSESSPTGAALSDNDISLVASMLCLSAMLGVAMFAYIADTYGRRVCIMTIAALQALSWLVKLCTSSFSGLLIARVLCGIPSGGCFNIIPVYVKEISQDNIRGVLGTLLILMQNVGILSMFALGSRLEYHTVLWIAITVPIATVLLMLKAPESPAFLVKKGNIAKAEATVALLRGLEVTDKIVMSEVEMMQNEYSQFKSLPNISFVSIFKQKSWRNGFLLSLTIMSIFSCNGSYAIMTFASAILSSFGVTVSPELQALSFPAVMLLASLLSLFYVERLGRKQILSAAFLVTAGSLVCLATTLLAQQHGWAAPAWLPAAAMVLSLASGVSPVPYIIMSEMFHFQVRAKVLACVVTHAWFMSFTQLAAFGPLSAALGLHSTFFAFAAVNLCGALVSLTLLPETKGKTLEQIEISLRGKHFFR